LPTPFPRHSLTVNIEPFFAGLMFLFFFGPHMAFRGMTGPANFLSYVILFFLIARRWKKILYVFTLDPFPILMLGMALTSILWSAAPDTTSLEVRSVVRSTIFGAYLATRYNSKELMAILAWAIGIGAILSLAAGVALPEIALRENSWAGIFAHKNILGYVMTIGALVFLHRLFFTRNRRWIALILLLIILSLLFLSQGKTSWTALCIALSLFPIQGFVNQHYKTRIASYLIFVLLIGGAIVLIASNLEEIVVHGLGKDLNFNGRIPIWQLMVEQGLKRPWLGYGFSGFWTSDAGDFVLGQSWAAASKGLIRFNAHNGYMDTFLQFGFVGLSLYVATIISSITRLVKLLSAEQDTSGNLWMLQSLLAMAFMNLADSFGSLSGTTHWSLFICISLSSALQQARLKRTSSQTHFNQALSSSS